MVNLPIRVVVDGIDDMVEVKVIDSVPIVISVDIDIEVEQVVDVVPIVVRVDVQIVQTVAAPAPIVQDPGDLVAIRRSWLH